MVLIPFGSACRVRFSLDRYQPYGKETNLFDWNITNFATLVYVMKNIDKPFEADEFQNLNQTSNSGHRMVSHKFVQLLSMHDFPMDQSYEAYMPTFLETYNRRKQRLKYTILTERNVHLIHFLSINTGPHLYIPSMYELCELYNAIRVFQPNPDVHLHLLVHPDQHHQSPLIDILKITNYIHVHYMRRTGPIVPNETQMALYWNWDEIYNSIPK